ncbi:MAG TPA: hypothetical protein VFT15_15790 [Chitinophagaceae bacterium]|nr:hypothetical protein [Chitinophagaceae bacterium]
MEVHHHTHSSRKKWTHYFWEFLMLFLAVFCGFLAEYQLEHVIEKQREKQYMESFVYDLQSDTALLNEGFPLKEARVTAIDSVFLFFKDNKNAGRIPGFIYSNMRRTLWDRHYRRNSTTIDQLKNAGGMRLIRNKKIADSIAAYDLAWLRAEFWRERYMTRQVEGQHLINKILDANDLVNSYYENIVPSNLPRSVTDTLNVRLNRDELNEYLNFLHDQKTSTKQDKMSYQSIELRAERLIELIKNEYHLK